MSDAAITVVAIILGVVLMFVFPLMTMADKKDDVSTMKVQTETTRFVNQERTKGKITSDDVQNFVSTINDGPDTFDYEFIVEITDVNNGKKSADGAFSNVGDNEYIVQYHKQIMDQLSDKGEYPLGEGYIFTVKVKNINKTISNQLRNMWFRVTGNEDGNITASASGMVTTTGTIKN